MILKPTNSLFPILAMGIFMSLPAIGQEEKSHLEYEALSKEYKNESDVADSEVKVVSKPVNVVAPRDSVIAQPKSIKPSNKPADKASKQEDQDPLSFNFLYYIIEKFKMSDMIE